MPIIDTHCHVSPYWYEPAEALLFHMDRNNVEQALLVQYQGQFDNSYQTDCAQRYPDRLHSVVLVDTQSKNACTELERLSAQGAVGVRLRADTRSPGDDPLAIWRKAEQLGMPISCNGNSVLLSGTAFRRVLEAVPDAPIIIEHLGSANHPDGEDTPYLVRRQVFDLARYPNVYIKIHGLGEILERTTPVEQPFPFKRDHMTILDMAYESFGPARMMWGSDWPPVSGREGYANALRWPMEHFAKGPDTDQKKIFAATAAKVYGLKM